MYSTQYKLEKNIDILKCMEIKNIVTLKEL